MLQAFMPPRIAQRNCVWLTLSILVLSPVEALAQSPSDAGPAEANKLFDTAIDLRDSDEEASAAKAMEAAVTMHQSVLRIPENSETRGTRDFQINFVLNAYRFAFDRTRACDIVDSAENAVTAYLKTVKPGQEAYTSIAESIESFRRDSQCPSNLVEEFAPKKSPAEQVPSPLLNVRGRQATTPKPKEGNESLQSQKSEHRYKTYTGLAIASGILTGASLAGFVGTGVPRVYSPFEGRAYAAVVDAAEMSLKDSDPDNDVHPGRGDDICVVARGTGAESVNQYVVEACDDFDQLGRAQIATGITAGVLLVSTVVFSVLATRQKNRDSQLAKRRLEVGFVPGQRVMMTARFSF